MSKILLIDIDSTIPNLALMKYSTYFKALNYEVTLMQLNIPYYPNKKANTYYIDTSKYSKVLASTIFKDNYKYVKGENIIFGGTGFSLKRNLSPKIEKLECDYSLYNEEEKTYDFITRGCIRNCYFCCVPKKEGNLHLVKNVDIIIKQTKRREHKEIVFLDNNFLAYENHVEVLKKLVVCKLKIDLNQGLDFRLLTEENQSLLLKLKYQSEYIFAFDDWKYKKMIDNKKELLQKFGSWKVKMYIYINPRMKLSDTINRILYCKNHKYLPYIMRDISCWESENRNFYIDIAAYCNQPSMFKKLTFEEFLNKRHTNKNRISYNLKLWEEVI